MVVTLTNSVDVVDEIFGDVKEEYCVDEVFDAVDCAADEIFDDVEVDCVVDDVFDAVECAADDIFDAIEVDCVVDDVFDAVECVADDIFDAVELKCIVDEGIAVVIGEVIKVIEIDDIRFDEDVTREAVEEF